MNIQRVRAYERFLSSDALQGRGSATRDEQIAAIYVGSQFETFHLQPDPQTRSFTQGIGFVQPEFDGHAKLFGPGLSLTEQADFRLMASSGEAAKGNLVRANPGNLRGLKITHSNAVFLEFQNAHPEQVFPAVNCCP